MQILPVLGREVKRVKSVGKWQDALAATHADADVIWGSVSADATALENGLLLSDLPLWENSIPGWVIACWRTLKSELLSDAPHWKVWTDWYNDRINGDDVAARRGRPAILELEIERALITWEIWEQGAEVVNAEIARIEAKYWTLPEDSIEASFKKPVSEEALQSPAPHEFLVGNKITARPQTTPVFDDKFANSIARKLQTKADNVRKALKDNYADEDVTESVEELLAALVTAPLSEGDLLMAYRSLQASSASYLHPKSERERSIVKLLTDLITSTEDLLNCFPNIQKIEASRTALRFQKEGVETFAQSVRDLSFRAKESDLVDETALHVLNDGVRRIEALDAQMRSLQSDFSALAIVIEQRAIIASTHALDVRNFGAAIVEKSEKTPSTLKEKKLLSKLRSSAEAGLLAGVEDGVKVAAKTTIVAGIAGLVALVTGPFIALAAVVPGMLAVSTKLKQLDDEVSSTDDVKEA